MWEKKSFNQIKLADLQSKTNRFLDWGIATSYWDKDQRHQEKSSSIGGCLTIGHPGQVPQGGPQANSSGKTASAIYYPAPWRWGEFSVVWMLFVGHDRREELRRFNLLLLR
jgi:hypothetical protein